MWHELRFAWLRCVWQIHIATTPVRSINFRKGLFSSEITQNEAKPGVLGFMFLWQLAARPSLPPKTTLKSYSKFFCANFFVNKKCNGNREVLSSSQHEICPMLVRQTLLMAPEGLAWVRAALWEGSGNCAALSQPSPTPVPAVVRDVEILFKIGKSMIVWSHSCSPIPPSYPYPQIYGHPWSSVSEMTKCFAPWFQLHLI